MQIISHRGYWKKRSEQNTAQSFRHSFLQGFGIETDVRDCVGDLVISHDPPKDKRLTLDAVFALRKDTSGAERLPLALNVKCDGLQDLLKEKLEKYSVRNYFLFDMSVPDMLLWSRSGLRFFTRQSELETVPSMYREAAGVWMDSFFDDWIRERGIETHIRNGKQVCIVSPELHSRPHLKFWGCLKRMEISRLRKGRGNGKLMLCTDFPIEANEYFSE